MVSKLLNISLIEEQTNHLFAIIYMMLNVQIEGKTLIPSIEIYNTLKFKESISYET